MYMSVLIKVRSVKHKLKWSLFTVGGTYACEPLPHNLSDVFEPSPQTSTTDSVDIANAVRLSTAMETTPDAGLSVRDYFSSNVVIVVREERGNITFQTDKARQVDVGLLLLGITPH